jgi:hypothetical protein
MTDFNLIVKLFFRKIVFLFLLFLFMYLDSNQLAENFEHGFLILNILSFIAFFYLIKRSRVKVKQLLICYVIAALLTEYYFSLYLEAYSYKRKYIPLYVLFGHAIIYERIYTFSKASVVKRNKIIIHAVYIFVILLLGAFFFFLKNDYFGLFLTFIFFLFVFILKRARTYFLTSYIVLVVLELLGVYFGCWTWKEYGFGYFNFIPSSNPPIGISICYFIITSLAYFIYFLLNKELWNRFKRINLKNFNKGITITQK